jgi:hypothetical protein
VNRAALVVIVGMTDFELENAIESYAIHDKALAAMKPIVDEHKALREKLHNHAIATQGDDPERTLSLSNGKHTITWSPKENQRRIVNLGAVKKRLGLPLLMKLVTMTLKNLDAHISTVEQATLGITVSERTGPRDCKVVAKLPVTSVVDLAA